MSTAKETTAAELASSRRRRLLLAAAILTGGVYFFVGHDLQVSTFERYAPWSDADETIVTAGSNSTKGAALAALGLFGAYLLTRRGGLTLHLTGWLPTSMAIFLLWASASVLWSDDPGLSCRRLAVLLFCVLAACGIARQFPGRDLVRMAVGMTAAYLAIGIAAEIALGTFRPWAAEYRFAGTVHPNTQGAYLAVLCLGLFCSARFANDRQSWYWAGLGVAGVFLLLTKSRTSCAAAVIAAGVLWMLTTTPRVRWTTVATLGFLFCGGLLLGMVASGNLEEKAGNLIMLGREQDSEALTGRLPIWQELLGYARQKPLQGYGFESFWTLDHVEDVSEEMQWPLREAHNAYLDALLSVGLIGLTAMLVSVAIALKQFAGWLLAAPGPGVAFGLCLLVFGLLNACMETGMGSANFLTLIAGACVLQLFFMEAPNQSAEPEFRAETISLPHRPC